MFPQCPLSLSWSSRTPPFITSFLCRELCGLLSSLRVTCSSSQWRLGHLRTHRTGVSSHFWEHSYWGPREGSCGLCGLPRDPPSRVLPRAVLPLWLLVAVFCIYLQV
jgi:hypothetical protein